MNKRWKNFWIRLLAAAILLLAVPFQSFAASGRIAFSDPSGQVGQEISVTMKFTSLGGEPLGNTDVMLAYDAQSLEYINETENASGGAGAIRVWSAPTGSAEAVTILRFKALKPGTTTITITSWEAYDNDGQTMTVEREGSSTITVSALETSSTDVRLQSLQVSPGALTPSFSPNVTDYAVVVGLDTTNLTVSAVANNEHASVNVEGGTDLQEGENTVVCHVTAEDGTSTGAYTITVTRVEGGEASAALNGQAEEPEVLAELDVTAKKIRVINLPDGVEVPEGFKESTIAIGDTKVLGWTWAEDGSPRYCVFYGMNENGEQDFYRYDIAEKTIQRYFKDYKTSSYTDEEYVELAEKYNSLVDDLGKLRIYQILMVVFIVISIVLLIMLKRNSDAKRRDASVRGTSRRGRNSGSRGEPRGSISDEEFKERDTAMEDDGYEEESRTRVEYRGEAGPKAGGSTDSAEGRGQISDMPLDLTPEEQDLEDESSRKVGYAANPSEKADSGQGEDDDFEFIDM